MTGEAVFNRVPAQPGAGDGREQWIVWSATAFGEPDTQHPHGQLRQRCRAFLAAFADTSNVGAGSEDDVTDCEAGQFGDPQPGLDREHEHGAVAPPGPGGAVGAGEQCADLGLGEPADQVVLKAFGRNRQDLLDRRGVFGLAQGAGGAFSHPGHRQRQRRTTLVKDHALAGVVSAPVAGRGPVVTARAGGASVPSSGPAASPDNWSGRRASRAHLQVSQRVLLTEGQAVATLSLWFLARCRVAGSMPRATYKKYAQVDPTGDGVPKIRRYHERWNRVWESLTGRSH